METLEEWRNFVEDLKKEWKTLWWDRIDDRVRAEGIANRDYLRLFVDRGTVIIATRDYKRPDFVEILEKYKLPNVERLVPLSPYVGGWGKFIRSILSKQRRFSRRKRPVPLESDHRKDQQLKKGGRGWLHLKWRK